VNAVTLILSLTFVLSSVSSTVFTVFVELPSIKPSEDIAPDRFLALFLNFDVKLNPNRGFFTLVVAFAGGAVSCVIENYFIVIIIFLS
jgi:hypothetical protein